MRVPPPSSLELGVATTPVFLGHPHQSVGHWYFATMDPLPQTNGEPQPSTSRQPQPSTSHAVDISVFLVSWCSFSLAVLPSPSIPESLDDTPEGYYAFVESSNVVPPQVRPPPYFRTNKPCPGLMDLSAKKSLKNLCGDLNKGFIPRNPMKQNVLGSPYPFDLLKNKTLEFFSKSLPILQADESLPKVTKYQQHYSEDYHGFSNSAKHRAKRQDHIQQSLEILRGLVSGSYHEDVINSTRRIARKFCEHGGGVLCMLIRAIQGEPLYGVSHHYPEQRDELAELRREDVVGNSLPLDGPPTPCPAKVEYATPVFARNYQGIWRYVVQIPYEGYFTQTVEITKCLQTKCYYLEGGCLSSPRWLSLLVAEIYYPEAYFPPDSRPQAPRSPVQGVEPPTAPSNYHQFSSRSGVAPDKTTSKAHCDGVDDLGCFQVRLYYDWFLVPGSCKCWRPDYFSRYIRRKHSTPEL